MLASVQRQLDNVVTHKENIPDEAFIRAAYNPLYLHNQYRKKLEAHYKKKGTTPPCSR